MKESQLKRGNEINIMVSELRDLIEKIRDKDHSIEIVVYPKSGNPIIISPLVEKMQDHQEFVVADLFDQIFKLEKEFKQL